MAMFHVDHIERDIDTLVVSPAGAIMVLPLFRLLTVFVTACTEEFVRLW